MGALTFKRLRERKEWQFFGVLPKADRPLAAAWWLMLFLRGLLPAVFALAVGSVVARVNEGGNVSGSLIRPWAPRGLEIG